MKQFPENMTIGEKYEPAMRITEQGEADAYFELCVQHTMRYTLDDKYKAREAAEQVERSNLGYYAGYHGSHTRERIERLFHCSHPIFGSIEQFGIPTPEAASQSGVERGLQCAEEER